MDLLERLRSMIAVDVPHTNGTLTQHLVSVYKGLQSWDLGEEVCRAGFLHSIYGTERFSEVTAPVGNRNEIASVFGIKAERIAYTNCAMISEDFDLLLWKSAPSYTMVDRFTKDQITLSIEDFHGLCAVHLADWLDQVEKSKSWSWRFRAFKRMADLVGEKAVVTFQWIYRNYRQ